MIIFAIKFPILKLLIIDNYDSFTYNLVRLVEETGFNDYLLIKNDKIDGLTSHDFDKVLITPGPGLASETGSFPLFLKEFYRQKSFLGICLGFEVIGEFFGAKLLQLPQPLHGIKNKGLVIDSRHIFNGLPKSFFIGHYHSWYFNEKLFSDELKITMKDENNLIMAFRHNKFDLTGLQFHPESIMTEYGHKIMQNWLKA